LLPVFGRHRNLAGELIPNEAHRLLGWVELELSHNGMLLRGYRSLFASLLLIATGLVCTGLLALRMSRTINAPLGQIKQAVAQLKDGNLETRLPPLGSQELDELASGINRMAETLHNAQEELQHSVDQATEDVRQNLETIEIQNLELDLARKEALEASRIKSEFLANMSHEIRTPLNGILGFTHLLQKSELTPRQFDYLGTIEKSADNLLGIINEILDFSKIEAGKLVLDNIPFNLRDLLQDTLTILAPPPTTKAWSWSAWSTATRRCRWWATRCVSSRSSPTWSTTPSSSPAKAPLPCAPCSKTRTKRNRWQRATAHQRAGHRHRPHRPGCARPVPGL
jgi:two-component system, NarL family, sensor histidine kinase BarA